MSSPLPIIKVNARAPFIFPEIRRGEGGRSPTRGAEPPSNTAAAKRSHDHETPIARNLRHRPAAARMGRALLADRADHHLLRDHGAGRGLCRGRGPRGHAGGHRRCLRPPHGGRKPREHRVDVATRLVLGLHPAARSHGLRRLRGARDGLLGHPRQDARPAGLGASGRADERQAARLYLPLPRGRSARGRCAPLLDRASGPGRGRRRPSGRGLDGGEIRPRRPLHDPRRPCARGIGHQPLGAVLRKDPRGGGRPGRSSLWHARTVHAGPCDPAGEGIGAA